MTGPFRRFFALSLILGCALLPVLEASAPIAEGSTEEIRIRRLAALGRLWGVVLYFHPRTGSNQVDWDRALLEAIPLVNQAERAADYRAAVEQMLSFLEDPSSGPVPDAFPQFEPAPDTERQPYTLQLEDGLSFVSATAYSQFNTPQASQDLVKVFKEACPAPLTVVDLRKQSRGFAGEWRLPQHLKAALPACLDRPVALSSSRRRKHSGFPPQSMASSGGYWTGFEMSSGGLLPAHLEEGQAGRLVFVINQGTPSNLVPLLGGLQAGAGAAILYQGEEAVQQGEGSFRMDLGEGLQVKVRLSEWLHPDGTLGLRPDRMIEQGEWSPQQLVEIAHETLAGKGNPAAEAVSATAANKTGTNADEDFFPSAPHRLLGLFRFWNAFHFFSPNKQHLDEPWEEVLGEMIPVFEAASDATQYALAASQLAVRTRDSHSFVFSKELTEFFGTSRPPLVAWPVQGQTVVVRVVDEEKAPGVEVGDVILEVDSRPAAQRLEMLGRYMAASTPQALSHRSHRSLLSGAEGSQALLKIRKADGQIREVRLQRGRFDPRWHRQGPIYRLLQEGFGYMDLARLQRNQVHSAFEELWEAPGIIFDMRGYPNGTAWVIAPFLTPESLPAARFSRPEPSTPDADWNQSLSFVQRTGEPAAKRYQEKVVVLIDGRAISQAEHTCLFIEAATQGEAVFIGSPTNGANGDVTDVVLPGGIRMMMTGHNVRHADGSPLQRVGIQPHIRVEPTIEGIRQGRDELLEAALRFLRQQTEDGR